MLEEFVVDSNLRFLGKVTKNIPHQDDVEYWQLLPVVHEVEDFKADVDFNVVMTEKGDFVEVQGTGEERPFSRAAMDEMLRLAEAGIQHLTAVQKEAISTMSR